MFFKKREVAERDVKKGVVLPILNDGLPVLPNAFVVIDLTADGLEFFSNHQVFNIPLSKIHSIDYKTGVSLEHMVGQSVAGIITGASLAGAAGAMVGGRVKTSKERVDYKLLVINYQSDGFKTIVFDADKDFMGTNALVKYFKQLKPESDHVRTEL